MWSITRACSGKMRSTPWLKLTFRTVIVSPIPVLFLAISVPSNACSRSLSPSLILTCTRIVSPGRNSGMSVRLCLFMNLVNSALFICLLPYSFYLLCRKTAPSLSRLRNPQQIRAQPAGLLDRRLPPPAADLLVVPAQQHLGYTDAAKLGPPRILRTIQNPVGLAERLHHSRILIPQHTRHAARDHIDHHGGRQF